MLTTTAMWTNLVSDALTMLPMLVLFALVNDVLDLVQTTLVIDLPEEQRRVRTIKGFQTFVSLAALQGGTLLGYEWRFVGDPPVPFQLSAVIALISMLMLFLVKPRG